MTPLDVNTMNHIDGVYAFCAVAATVGMLLLLVRVFKQERAKPSKEFRETKQDQAAKAKKAQAGKSSVVWRCRRQRVQKFFLR